MRGGENMNYHQKKQTDYDALVVDWAGRDNGQVPEAVRTHLTKFIGDHFAIGRETGSLWIAAKAAQEKVQEQVYGPLGLTLGYIESASQGTGVEVPGPETIFEVNARAAALPSSQRYQRVLDAIRLAKEEVLRGGSEIGDVVETSSRQQ